MDLAKLKSLVVFENNAVRGVEGFVKYNVTGKEGEVIEVYSHWNGNEWKESYCIYKCEVRLLIDHPGYKMLSEEDLNNFDSVE